MIEILIEDILFVALIAAVVVLIYLLLMQFTPVGVRLRQRRNRSDIEHAAELVCPIHGPHTSEELVRLPDGEVLCPDCYKEITNG